MMTVISFIQALASSVSVFWPRCYVLSADEVQDSQHSSVMKDSQATNFTVLLCMIVFAIMLATLLGLSVVLIDDVALVL